MIIFFVQLILTLCGNCFVPDLKLLSIRACPSVTPEGLLSVLALPFLHHLDYYTANPVPKSFVRQIAAQNPSLESISVHTSATPGDSDDESPRTLLYWMPLTWIALGRLRRRKTRSTPGSKHCTIWWASLPTTTILLCGCRFLHWIKFR